MTEIAIPLSLPGGTVCNLISLDLFVTLNRSQENKREQWMGNKTCQQAMVSVSIIT